VAAWVRFLLSTQAPDGSWHVVSRWAVMALARALGPARKSEVVIDVRPTPEPWVETVLFGSTADFGGTTALMLPMPDLEKAKLLIEHGAKINARSKSRFSALMVAAQYPQSSSTIRFLLSQGAEVQMAKGAGKPLFNAAPLMLAAGALNAEIIKPLHDGRRHQHQDGSDRPVPEYAFAANDWFRGRGRDSGAARLWRSGQSRG
jgi:hypothetical protein